MRLPVDLHFAIRRTRSRRLISGRWIAVAIVLSTVVASSTLRAESVNFDTLPDGSVPAGSTVITDQYATQGVVFSSTAGGGLISENSGEEQSSPNMLVGNPSSFEPIEAAFEPPVSQLSVVLVSVGDATVTVTTFDAAGAEVARIDVTNPGTGVGFANKNQVSVPGERIVRLRFEITKTFEGDGFAIDDLVFEPATPTGPSVAAVLNGASFAEAALAPGEIVSMFGPELGPDEIVTFELTEDGSTFTKALAGTTVFFDEFASALIFVAKNQLSAIVPYGVAGRDEVKIRVEASEQISPEFTAPLAEAAPGIFTINSSGSGPGAVLNQDFSVNSAANAAERDSIVQIFATGGGLGMPPELDGQIATGITSLGLSVEAEVGGVPAEIIYAGSAPGLVSGVIQVNIRIPASATIGNAVAVVLRIGGISSQDSATVAVR